MDPIGPENIGFLPRVNHVNLKGGKSSSTDLLRSLAQRLRRLCHSNFKVPNCDVKFIEELYDLSMLPLGEDYDVARLIQSVSVFGEEEMSQHRELGVLEEWRQLVGCLSVVASGSSTTMVTVWAASTARGQNQGCAPSSSVRLAETYS